MELKVRGTRATEAQPPDVSLSPPQSPRMGPGWRVTRRRRRRRRPCWLHRNPSRVLDCEQFLRFSELIPLEQDKHDWYKSALYTHIKASLLPNPDELYRDTNTHSSNLSASSLGGLAEQITDVKQVLEGD